MGDKIDALNEKVLTNQIRMQDSLNALTERGG